MTIMKMLNALILFTFVLITSIAGTGAPIYAAEMVDAGKTISNNAPLHGSDVHGKSYALNNQPTVQLTAVVFMSVDCPISNKYVPELNRLAKLAAANENVQFFGVISDPTVSLAKAAAFAKEYDLAFPLLFDATGELAARLVPTITPEAMLLDRSGRIVYRGRIDDRFIDLRKQNPEVKTHDLEDAAKALLAGKAPAVAKTQAVGCYFEAWGKDFPVPKIVTYNRDIAPILNANCVQCHRDGEIAPFSLMTYQTAAKHARQIARVTDERLMPPWKAQPGFGHFAEERRLSDREIATIAAWAKADAPAGDPADLPPPPVFTSEWVLGKPDVEAVMTEAFPVPAEGRDAYRVFSIPIDVPEDKYIIAFQFKPGATAVVHHALLYLDDKHQARELAKASTDGLPGYQSFGGVKFRPSGSIGVWAPGATPYFLPDGVGKPIHKGTDVVMQVHYHPNGKPHIDKSKLAIYFAKKPVTKIAVSFMLSNGAIDIPPGEAHYNRVAMLGPLPADVTLMGVGPHMHLVGKKMKVIATLPDHTIVPLINITDWDFRWQDQYRFAEPIKLPKGTLVSLEAEYDNSTNNPDNPSNPPKRVRRGEQTTDEMCICFFNYTVDDAPLKPNSKATGGSFLKQLFGGK